VVFLLGVVAHMAQWYTIRE